MTIQYTNITPLATCFPHYSEADVTECTIRPHDYIALCCDGITDVMELEDVARITSNLLYQQSATAQTVSGRLVELALQLGSSDNCTVIVVKVESER
jgi:serine/threonine protein phosphatase PrpC